MLGYRLRKHTNAGSLVMLLTVLGVTIVGVAVLIEAHASGLIGDLNNDGVVNVFDLSILLSDWGTTNATADLNGDGTVNVFDLSILLSHWGQTASSTPSPTPSSTPAPTASPSPTPSSGPACVTSSFNGYCPGPGEDYKDPNIFGSNGSNTYINTDVFSPVSGTSITLTANSAENWNAVATIPNGNTSVVMAPQTRQDYTLNNLPVPLSNFPALYSSFSETMQQVSGVAYDAGYDLWGGNTGDSSSDFSHEMMIWIDQVNRGTCGGATRLATTTLGGTHGAPVQTWTLCRNGPAGSTSEYIWYLSDSSGNALSEQSGTVDILPFVNYMISHGYYPSDYGVDQLVFTNEICSTGGVPAKFTVSKFTVSGN